MSNYYLGGDASKGYCDFVIVDAEKKIVEPDFQLDDTANGHQALFKLVRKFFTQHSDSTLYAAVESTGGYENNWYERMKDFGHTLPIHVARLNPAAVKADHDAGLKRNKTDAIGALDVATFQITHPEKVKYDEDTYPMLRRCWRFIRLLTKQKTQLINQLDSLLYISLPELLVFCREGYSQWLLQVLTRYSTYEALRSAGVQELRKLPYLTPEKAEQLIGLIQPGQTIGASDAISSQIIQSLAAQILHLDQLISQHKVFLEEHCDEAKEEIAILTSFKGIGVFSAIGLLINMIDVNRYATAKKLTSYFGLHPELKLSGDGVWKMCMSKKGRIEPRAILFMVVLCAIRCNPVIKPLYEKRVSNGMNKMAAIGLCMHKTLRVIYGMLKHKKLFDPNIDKINQAKSQQAASKPKKDKKRRLQDFDKQAPISPRQNRKRKQSKLPASAAAATAPEPSSQPERRAGDWMNLSTLLPSYPQSDDTVSKKSEKIT